MKPDKNRLKLYVQLVTGKLHQIFCVLAPILSKQTSALSVYPFLSFYLKFSKLTIRGFPGGTVVKNLPANAGDTRDVGLIPGSGISPGEGNGKPLQYFCLENSLGTGIRWTTAHGSTNSQTQLRDWAHTHTHTQNSLGFPGGTVVKNLPASEGDTGDLGSTLGSGRSPGEELVGRFYRLPWLHAVVS